MNENTQQHKLNILIVSPYFFPVVGGVENNVLNMALQCLADGHRVTVATSDRKAGKIFDRKTEEYQGIRIVRLRRWLFGQYYLTMIPGLISVLFKERYDVIHSHIPGVMFTEIALIIRKLTTRSSVFINTPHDPFMSRVNYTLPEKVMKSIFLPILKVYYSWLYDYAIAVNPMQRSWITGEYSIPDSRVVDVLNAIEDKLFEVTPMDSQLKKQLGLTDQLVISSLARYHEYKGYQNILAAINKLPKKLKKKIKYIGMGSDAGMLSRLRNYIRHNDLEDTAILLENPSDNTRDQVLSESQIFVMGSQVEAFGIAIVEAMAKGNAIISTRTEGGRYLVRQESGYLYDFDEIPVLTDLLANLIENPSQRSEMIKSNLSYSREFRWEVVFKPYKELLEEISRKA